MLHLRHVRDLLTPEECTALIALMAPQLRASTITNPNEPDQSFRTSQTCDAGLIDDPLIRAVDDRICQLVGQPAPLGETLQGQRYQAGEQFKAHCDFFNASALAQHMTPAWGQRSWTVMVWLQAPEAGGATVFPRAGLTCTPIPGAALVWHNLLTTGPANPDTLHAGEPVTAGEKWILTKWFRVPRYSTTTAERPAVVKAS